MKPYAATRASDPTPSASGTDVEHARRGGRAAAGALRLLAATALFAVACGNEPSKPGVDAGAPDSGCSIPCGAVCCTEGQACVDGACACAPNCEGKHCGPDGCGGSCGDCQSGWTCNEASAQCECTGETDDELCARDHVECGPLTTVDRCTRDRTVHDCGACGEGETCSVTGRCACVPESDRHFCDRLGKQCGALTADDNCGTSRAVAECGPCDPSARCTTDGQCEPCTRESDQTFCLRNWKNCGIVEAPDNCGYSRTVASCGTCAAPDVCDDYNVCNLPGAPTNDRCFGATPILPDATGHATLQVNTSTANDDLAGSCAPGTAKDLVYRLELTGTRDLEVVATPASDAAAPAAIFLTRGCDQASVELACVAGDTATAAARLVRPALARGLYYLWVEGPQSLTEGALTVSVTITDGPAAPPNDLCASATPLTLAGGMVKADGTTMGAADDESGACGPADGAEVFYQFTLGEESAVLIRATGRDPTPAFVPLLEVRTACTGGTDMGCSVNGSAFIGHLAQGTYVLVVDGTAGARGDFTLEVLASPTGDNDTCATAHEIALDPATRSGAAVGDTSGATDGNQSECDHYVSGNDLVYYFDVPSGSPQRVQITGAALPGSNLLPSLLVTTACERPRIDLKCQEGSPYHPTEMLLKSLPPGRYYLYVDGSAISNGPGQFTPTNGPFALTVTLSTPPTPPANDTCAAAVALPLSATNHRATVTGTTVNATNDVLGSCGGSLGGDVVYRFDLPQAGSVRATARRDSASPDYWPVVLLRDSNCASSSASAERACAVADNGAASAAAANLPQGTYYVIVDSGGETEGGFELEVSWADPILNDTCASVAALQLDPLTLSASVQSDNGGVADDITSGCNSYTGKDLVWSLTVPTGGGAKNVVIDAIGAAGSAFIPNLSVRQQCDYQATEVACVSVSGAGQSAHLRLNHVPEGTTYYVWVDGAGPSYNGPFTLSAQLLTPPAPPAFDSCSAPKALLFDMAGVATATDSTDDATDGSTGTCGSFTGPDVVYSFSLGAAASVSARVSRDSASPGFTPAVYIRSACASGASTDEKACASTSAGAALAVAANLPQGDYFIIVDGAANTSGGFQLEVRKAPPIDNSTCAAAQPLALDPRTPTTTVVSDTTPASDTTSSSCLSNGGRDLVWAVEVPAGPRQDLTITAAAAPGAPFGQGFSLSLRRDCASVASELACQFQFFGNTTMSVARVQPGTYYLWVQSNSITRDGPFTLTLTTAASATTGPTNDVCLAATELLIDTTTGIGLGSGATDDASNDGDGSCRGGSGGDVVFYFDLAQEKNVEVSITPAPGSSYQPAAYLRSTCDQASSELACNFSNDPTVPLVLNAQRLPQGRYYLWVDSAMSYSWAAGSFAVQVTTTTPPVGPPNDTCAGTVPEVTIDATTHLGSITGSTATATSDYAGTCATASDAHTGGDVVYKFVLAGPADVTAKVTRSATTPTFRPAVYIRSVCDSALGGNQNGCANEGTATPGIAQTVGRSLAAGTWFVIVDGLNGSSGDFTLQLTEGPAMTNDNCTTALGLTFDATGHATLRGDTTNAANDTLWSANCPGQTGADVVYSFSTQGRGALQLTATMTFDNTYNWPAMHLRTVCDSMMSPDEVACGRGTSGPLSITADLPEGIYYLWADSAYYSDKGPFTLEVQLTSLGPPPANDACRNAEMLQFTADVAQASGSTRTATDDYTSSCGSMNGGDVVYEVVLAQDAMLSATVTRDASFPAYNPGVYIRASTTCTSGAAADQLACGAPQSGSATATVAALAAGHYFVIVDGDGRSGGGYSLTVRTGPAMWNDTCAQPQALGFDPTTGLATANGDLTYASGSGDGSCNSGSGADLVYSFTTLQPKTFQADLMSSGTTLRPTLYLRAASCAGTGATELACSVAAAGAASTSLFVPRLPAGDYFLWVDSFSPSTAGPFTLDASLTTPPAAPGNEGCGAPTPITFATGATTATETGDTTYAADDAAPSCAAAGGADVVYSLTLSGAQKVVARVTRAATAPSGFNPVVYIRGSACIDPAQGSVELSCGRPTPSTGVATATLANAAAGTYWIWVDSAGAVGGAFTLDVELSTAVATAPTNEGCDNAQALVFSGTTATVTGSAAAVQDDANGTCSAAGADLVYKFTTTQVRRVTAKVMAATGFAPAVYIRKTACASLSAADELACNASATTGGTATAVVTSATAGDYWVFVDAGAANSSGLFTLEVKAESPAPPPTNDTCSSTQALTRSTMVFSDTSAAANDYSAAAHVCNTGPATPGPDLVFWYKPSSTGSFTVTASPSTSWDLVLWVHQGNYCYRPGVCQGVSNTGTAGAAESVTVSGQANQDYWIFVDGLSATDKGAFTIIVN